MFNHAVSPTCMENAWPKHTANGPKQVKEGRNYPRENQTIQVPVKPTYNGRCNKKELMQSPSYRTQIPVFGRLMWIQFPIQLHSHPQEKEEKKKKNQTK